MGLATVVLGLTGNVLIALAAASILGIANLVFIIPTQTIFIEITPIELMGRVVAFRGSLVFGAMTLAMGARRHPRRVDLSWHRDRGIRAADRARRVDRSPFAGCS